MDRLTHFDEDGAPTMVDVTPKTETARMARARGRVRLSPDVLEQVAEGYGPKGDLFTTARLAGIHGAKRCSDLIPLCHPLRITDVSVSIQARKDLGVLEIEAVVRAFDRTGVEMEAMTACSVAALTVYDMVKAVDRFASIERVELMEKLGGKSGHVRREVTK
jgi:cyclic pyranopterin monophosphate synthase